MNDSHNFSPINCINFFINIAYRLSNYCADLTAQRNLYFNRSLNLCTGKHHCTRLMQPFRLRVLLHDLRPVAVLLLFNCLLYGNKLLMYGNGNLEAR